MGPASARTEGGEAARGNDFVLVDGDGRAEMATAWVRSCGGRQAAKPRQRVMRSERSADSLLRAQVRYRASARAQSFQSG